MVCLQVFRPFPVNSNVLLPKGMPLRDARIIQLVWAVFLFLSIGIRAASEDAGGVAICTFSIAYLAACIGCFRDFRPCWAFAIAVPLLTLSVMVPVVFTSLSTIHSTQEHQALGTIVLAVVNTTLFIVPAFVICLSLMLDWKNLYSSLRGQTTGLDNDLADDDTRRTNHSVQSLLDSKASTRVQRAEP